MTSQLKSIVLFLSLASLVLSGCAIFAGSTKSKKAGTTEQKLTKKVNTKQQDDFLRWINDPKIKEIERAARKVLGWQIYGAINCGELSDSYFELDDYPLHLNVGFEDLPIIKRVSKLYRKKIPFIITLEIYGNEGFGENAEMYLKENRAIVGTRNGKIYEFWWSDSRRSDWAMIFSHRQWLKPTFKHKAFDILFFDADQKQK